MRVIGLLLSAVVSYAADHVLECDGIYTKILGHSGKITVAQSDDFDQDRGAVTIRFTDVSELDANGAVVGKSGSTKHTFANFASKDFEFLPTNWTTYQGLKAQKISFVADALVDANTMFRVDLLIFNESGTVSNDDEDLSVERGDVKFSVAIAGWPFCESSGTGAHACKKGNTDEVGAALEFTIEVSGQNGTATFEGSKLTFGNAHVIMSKKVNADGVWSDMASGYPKIGNATTGKASYTVRFPKFSDNVTYDPIVHMESGAFGSNLSLSLCFGLMALVLSMLK